MVEELSVRRCLQELSVRRCLHKLGNFSKCFKHLISVRRQKAFLGGIYLCEVRYNSLPSLLYIEYKGYIIRF